MENKILQTESYVILLALCQKQWSKEAPAYEYILSLKKSDNENVMKKPDVFFITEVSHSIISMIFPKIAFDGPGTSTKLEITILNNHSLEKDASGKEYLPALLTLHDVIWGKIKRKSMTYSGDAKIFLHLDIQLDFFVQDKKLAESRVQVYS